MLKVWGSIKKVGECKWK